MKKLILFIFLTALFSVGYSQSIQKWIMIHDSIVDQSGANYISFDANGIGVNTDSPSYPLDVNGSAHISDTLKVAGDNYITDDELWLGGLRMLRQFANQVVVGSPNSWGMYINPNYANIYTNGIKRFEVGKPYSWFTNNLGVGTSIPNTTIDIQGGQTWNVTTINTATYDLLVTDHILHVTYTGTGAVTSLTLPTAQAVEGRMVIIKDAGGNAATNNITIDTEGAETIDGSATLIINGDYDCAEIYSDGTNWFVKNIY